MDIITNITNCIKEKQMMTTQDNRLRCVITKDNNNINNVKLLNKKYKDSFFELDVFKNIFYGVSIVHFLVLILEIIFL